MALILPVGSSDHVQGNPSAKIELVEYGDYQCPYCQIAYHIIKRIQRDLAKELRFVFRNFPLSNIHPHALLAAQASEAAARQDKYWQMHDYLFEHHDNFNYESLLRAAQVLQMDIQRFREDLLDIDIDTPSKIDVDIFGGLRSGVNGTPTFFINGEKFKGNWQDGELAQTLKAMLAS